MELREKLEKLRRNGITLDISGSAEYKRGGTRFGGRPDVPRGFEWPAYEGEGMHGKTAKRPLSFIAQFDCAELAKYDAERLLPERGVLSFFYEMDSMRWGYDPKDKGCARVYWFEDSAALEEAEFPDDLLEDYRFPALKIKMRAEPSFPGWEDFTEIYPEEAESGDEGHRNLSRRGGERRRGRRVLHGARGARRRRPRRTLEAARLGRRDTGEHAGGMRARDARILSRRL